MAASRVRLRTLYAIQSRVSHSTRAEHETNATVAPRMDTFSLPTSSDWPGGPRVLAMQKAGPRIRGELAYSGECRQRLPPSLSMFRFLLLAQTFRAMRPLRCWAALVPCRRSREQPVIAAGALHICRRARGLLCSSGRIPPSVPVRTPPKHGNVQ